MSHHGNPSSPDPLSGAMEALLGEYPDGRLNKDDAGAIAMAVGSEKDRVVIKFAKPVAWIGMTGDEAMGLAQLLIEHARRAGITAPLVLRIGE